MVYDAPATILSSAKAAFTWTRSCPTKKHGLYSVCDKTALFPLGSRKISNEQFNQSEIGLRLGSSAIEAPGRHNFTGLPALMGLSS